MRCGHLVYVARAVEEQARAEFGAPPAGKDLAVERDVKDKRDLIVAGILTTDGKETRPVVYIRAGYHDVATVECHKLGDPLGMESTGRHKYDIDAYDQLDHLRLGTGYGSMFGPDGLVHNAGRSEGYLLAPTGMLSAGQPRKRGTQKIRWDEYSFDDPHCLIARCGCRRTSDAARTDPNAERSLSLNAQVLVELGFLAWGAVLTVWGALLFAQRQARRGGLLLKALPARVAEVTDDGAAASVCVVIPVHNAAEALRTCVEHVRRQDYPRLSVCIVDDRSNDDTTPTARQLAAQDSRIRVRARDSLPDAGSQIARAMGRHRDATKTGCCSSTTTACWIPLPCGPRSLRRGAETLRCCRSGAAAGGQLLETC